MMYNAYYREQEVFWIYEIDHGDGTQTYIDGEWDAWDEFEKLVSNDPYNEIESDDELEDILDSLLKDFILNHGTNYYDICITGMWSNEL